jgi:preprotein translocase subunit YajC
LKLPAPGAGLAARGATAPIEENAMWPFVETAYAMPPGTGGGDGASMLSGFLPLILVFAIFWFLVIRPQQKRAKEHRNLVSNLKKGDEVYTDSGIQGTIQKVSENSITLEIAPKVSIRIQRSRITELVRETRAPKEKDKEEDKPEAKGEEKSEGA